MRKLIKRISKKSGLTPGTLVHIGEKREERTKITVIDYNESQLEEREIENTDECISCRDTATVTWINVDGIHDVGVIEKIGNCFGLHPLVMEDIVNTAQRPKIEDYDNYIYIVIKMLYREKETDEMNAEQVSLVLGSNFVISFQEKEGDVFDTIRERIRNAKGRIRTMGADYLAYSLIDAVVDNYFSILEGIGENIEMMEDELVTNPTPKTLQVIHDLRGNMIFLRRSVWPLRDVINSLARGESSLIQENTKIYLRDVYDHTIQVIDNIETFRDMVSGMFDIYLSSISNRMNEIMKVLTIIATIFIPLTFIAGIYGMNFRYMPELEWRWSYPVVWVIICSVGTVMFTYFKRKNWL